MMPGNSYFLFLDDTNPDLVEAVCVGLFQQPDFRRFVHPPSRFPHLIPWVVFQSLMHVRA